MDMLHKLQSHEAISLFLLEGHLIFESVGTPGNHIGVVANGDVKSPKDTGEGISARFTPKVKEHVNCMY